MNYNVLDHGYVHFVESWGSDERIIEAARMSTGKGFLGWGSGDYQCKDCNASWGKEPEHDCCKCGGDLVKQTGDEKLLRFLYENRHDTPFEMAGMVIEVQAPIFVFREWHRHRTQCLVGNTQITCVTPAGSTYKRTIKEIFDLKHGGVIDNAPAKHKNGTSKAGTPVTRDARRKDAWRTRILPNCQTRTLRVLNEKTGEFETAPMAKVWESGVKVVYALTTANGRTVQASAEHPFFTKRGWVKLKDIVVGDSVARMGKVAAHERPIPPALRQGIGVWTSTMRTRLVHDGDHCYLCGIEAMKEELELDHVIPVTENLLRALDATNLKPVCVRCHRNKTDAEQPNREGMSKRGIRWEKIAELPQRVGDEMTYDIEVEGPHHNYLANDLVVHNSYNEMSARYAPLPDLNYVPSVERLMANARGPNKQAGTTAGAAALNENTADTFRAILKMQYEDAQTFYEQSLKDGIPKELARVHLPVGRYSRMRASANLRCWLGFVTLRSAPNAQWEIRQFSDAVAKILRFLYPRTMDLFDAKTR